VGDDVIDLPIMRRCGLAIAVANARPQVKAMAHYETPSLGGRGAARDAVEYVLQAQGTLDRVIDAYIQAKTSIEPK
jgi:3-deoxy-D-manno-octulosonate 8-phosphate phosphatase (KDO 8-P phosphatase)